MQETIFISLPVNELQSIITKCVKDCLKYPPIQERKEKLLTEVQTAALLRIPISTLKALINNGDIPIRIRAKQCYFSKSDLDLWRQDTEKEADHE